MKIEGVVMRDMGVMPKEAGAVAKSGSGPKEPSYPSVNFYGDEYKDFFKGLTIGEKQVMVAEVEVRGTSELRILKAGFKSGNADVKDMKDKELDKAIREGMTDDDDSGLESEHVGADEKAEEKKEKK